MASLVAQVDRSLGGAAEALAFFGIPNPYDMLDQFDGDPESITGTFQAFASMGQQVQLASQEVQSGAGRVVWQGPAAIAFNDTVADVVEALAVVAEAVILLVEAGVQVIDIIITYLAYALALVAFLLTALVVIFVTMSAIIAALAASIVGSPGIPGVISAAWGAATATAGTTAISAAGTAAALAAGLAAIGFVIRRGLDQVTEWTQDLRSEISELSPRIPTLPGVPNPEAPDVPVIPN